jgi:prephenate dehydratase
VAPVTTPIPRYGFLGPAGTFCQMALAAWPGSASGEAVPCDSVVAALDALRAGRLDAAMVPIENSVEGGVSATLDALSVGSDVVIIGEVLVPVTFVLAVRPGVRLSEVHAVGSHPHGWAQVRSWVHANLPAAAYVSTLSTAAAAADLAPQAAGPVTYQAAVCAPVAAQAYGLEVLAEDIGDSHHAVTRFALVARPGHTPPATGADKTTLVLYQRDDHPGGLLELLEQFAARGVNLTRLESRPTGEGMGSYCFSIDIEGHVGDARVAETLMGLKRVCAQVRYLGSYPRADRQVTTPLVGTSDTEFAAARQWLDRLLANG